MGSKTKPGYKRPSFEGVSAPIDLPEEAVDAGAKARAEQNKSVRVADIIDTNPYAPKAWGKKEIEEFDLEVPSGQLCRVRKLQSADVFRLGLLDMLDMFSPQLLDGVAEETGEKAELEALKDKTKRDGLFNTMDKVVMACVLEPRVVPSDHPGVQDGSAVCIEDLDLNDKMYIFSAAFGNDIDALKSQYAEQEEGLGDILHRKGVRDTSK